MDHNVNLWKSFYRTLDTSLLDTFLKTPFSSGQSHSPEISSTLIHILILQLRALKDNENEIKAYFLSHRGWHILRILSILPMESFRYIPSTQVVELLINILNLVFNSWDDDDDEEEDNSISFEDVLSVWTKVESRIEKRRKFYKRKSKSFKKSFDKVPFVKKTESFPHDFLFPSLSKARSSLEIETESDELHEQIFDDSKSQFIKLIHTFETKDNYSETQVSKLSTHSEKDLCSFILNIVFKILGNDIIVQKYKSSFTLSLSLAILASDKLASRSSKRNTVTFLLLKLLSVSLIGISVWNPEDCRVISSSSTLSSLLFSSLTILSNYKILQVHSVLFRGLGVLTKLERRKKTNNSSKSLTSHFSSLYTSFLLTKEALSSFLSIEHLQFSKPFSTFLFELIRCLSILGTCELKNPSLESLYLLKFLLSNLCSLIPFGVVDYLSQEFLCIHPQLLLLNLYAYLDPNTFDSKGQIWNNLERNVKHFISKHQNLSLKDSCTFYISRLSSLKTLESLNSIFIHLERLLDIHYEPLSMELFTFLILPFFQSFYVSSILSSKTRLLLHFCLKVTQRLLTSVSFYNAALCLQIPFSSLLLVTPRSLNAELINTLLSLILLELRHNIEEKTFGKLFQRRLLSSSLSLLESVPFLYTTFDDEVLLLWKIQLQLLCYNYFDESLNEVISKLLSFLLVILKESSSSSNTTKTTKSIFRLLGTLLRVLSYIEREKVSTKIEGRQQMKLPEILKKIQCLFDTEFFPLESLRMAQLCFFETLYEIPSLSIDSKKKSTVYFSPHGKQIPLSETSFFNSVSPFSSSSDNEDNEDEYNDDEYNDERERKSSKYRICSTYTSLLKFNIQLMTSKAFKKYGDEGIFGLKLFESSFEQHPQNAKAFLSMNLTSELLSHFRSNLIQGAMECVPILDLIIKLLRVSMTKTDLFLYFDFFKERSLPNADLLLNILESLIATSNHCPFTPYFSSSENSSPLSFSFDSELSSSESFTLSLWIQSSTSDTTTSSKILSLTLSLFSLTLYYNSSMRLLWIQLSESELSSFSSFSSSTTTTFFPLSATLFRESQWNQLAVSFTFESSERKVLIVCYINGSFESSSSCLFPSSSVSELPVPSSQSSTHHLSLYFHFSLGSVSIYKNVSLTAETALSLLVRGSNDYQIPISLALKSFPFLSKSLKDDKLKEIYESSLRKALHLFYTSSSPSLLLIYNSLSSSSSFDLGFWSSKKNTKLSPRVLLTSNSGVKVESKKLFKFSHLLMSQGGGTLSCLLLLARCFELNYEDKEISSCLNILLGSIFSCAEALNDFDRIQGFSLLGSLLSKKPLGPRSLLSLIHHSCSLPLFPSPLLSSDDQKRTLEYTMIPSVLLFPSLLNLVFRLKGLFTYTSESNTLLVLRALYHIVLFNGSLLRSLEYDTLLMSYIYETYLEDSRSFYLSNSAVGLVTDIFSELLGSPLESFVWRRTLATCLLLLEDAYDYSRIPFLSFSPYYFQIPESSKLFQSHKEFLETEKGKKEIFEHCDELNIPYRPGIQENEDDDEIDKGLHHQRDNLNYEEHNNKEGNPYKEKTKKNPELDFKSLLNKNEKTERSSYDSNSHSHNSLLKCEDKESKESPDSLFLVTHWLNSSVFEKEYKDERRQVKDESQKIAFSYSKFDELLISFLELLTGKYCNVEDSKVHSLNESFPLPETLLTLSRHRNSKLLSQVLILLSLVFKRSGSRFSECQISEYNILIAHGLQSREVLTYDVANGALNLMMGLVNVNLLENPEKYLTIVNPKSLSLILSLISHSSSFFSFSSSFSSSSIGILCLLRLHGILSQNLQLLRNAIESLGLLEVLVKKLCSCEPDNKIVFESLSNLLRLISLEYSNEPQKSSFAILSKTIFLLLSFPASVHCRKALIFFFEETFLHLHSGLFESGLSLSSFHYSEFTTSPSRTSLKKPARFRLFIPMVIKALSILLFNQKSFSEQCEKENNDNEESFFFSLLDFLTEEYKYSLDFRFKRRIWICGTELVGLASSLLIIGLSPLSPLTLRIRTLGFTRSSGQILAPFNYQVKALIYHLSESHSVERTYFDINVVQRASIESQNPYNCKEIIILLKGLMEEKIQFEEEILETNHKNFKVSLIDSVTRFKNTALSVLKTTTQLRDERRNDLLANCRRHLTLLVQAHLSWKSLLESSTHERALWHFSERAPKSLLLSEIEGPSRLRIRLQKGFSNIESKYYGSDDGGKGIPVFEPFRFLTEGPKGMFGVLLEQLSCSESSIIAMEQGVFVTAAAEYSGEIIISSSILYFIQERGDFNIRVPLENIEELHSRRFSLQDTALELFVIGGVTRLFNFVSKDIREKLFKYIVSCRPTLIKHSDHTNTVMKLWQEGLLSNYDYLMCLNKLGGRSFNDLMQYPVYPFILSDYSSSLLNLETSSSFRNLEKPISVQNSAKEKRYTENYRALSSELAKSETGGSEQICPDVGPYHYGSHYSNSGIVLHFLVRVPPFTKMFLDYQDGHFDLPDRSFHSLENTWRLASSDSSTDVKELIPDLFVFPELLVNFEGFDFGVKQNGESVNDVKLPPWSCNSARLFIKIHRQALESTYVKENLCYWIDLVFGYKQTGASAVKAINVFHPATYYGFDVASIQDPVQRNARSTMIRTYGQTPKQLFSKPHPMSKVNLSESSTLCKVQALPSVLGLRWGTYLGSPSETEPIIISSFRQETQVFEFLGVRGSNEIFGLPKNYTVLFKCRSEDSTLKMFMSSSVSSLITLSWNHEDGEIWIKMKKNTPFSILTTFHRDLNNKVSVISIEDSNFWIGYESGKILVIPVVCSEKTIEFSHSDSFVLYGHYGSVSLIQICSEFRIVVSASSDLSIIIWDINSKILLHSFTSSSLVKDLKVSKTSGDIVFFTSENHLHLFTCNGAEVSVTKNVQEVITALTLSNAPEGISINAILTGTETGVIYFWNSWNLSLFRQLLTFQTQPILSLAYSEDHQHLFCSTKDKKVIVFEKSHYKGFRAAPKYFNIIKM